MKKIAFLISDQHLIAHGGIGQFAKGFCELMASLGHSVDIINDRKPKDPFAFTLVNDNVKLHYTKTPLDYTNYNIIYLYRKGIHLERIVNFQNSIKSVLEVNDYDLMVVNGDEALAAAFNLRLNFPVVYYTHDYREIHRNVKVRDNFIPGYHEYFDSFFYSMRHIDIATQSEYNRQQIINNNVKTNVHHLPMPMSERNLLEPCFNEKRGVLYIGRWDDRKNSWAYVNMLKETKLPAKLLTNKIGKQKFEKVFAQYGITDYEIKTSVIGQEKVDFIKSCKVFYMPSLAENYPFAFLETAGHMPVVVLDQQQWTNNFDPRLYTKVSEDKAAETILEKYKIDIVDYYNTGNLDYIKMLDEQAPKLWKEFIEK